MTKNLHETEDSTLTKLKVWDVCVIGAGPAGMMSAGHAAGSGASVILLEKNKRPGEKLLITGGGRCNVTNAETNVREFLMRYKESDKFLFSAFSQFSSSDTLEFFNSRGVPTKVENEGRVFPQSNSAESIWNVMLDFVKESGVKIETNAVVAKISIENESVENSRSDKKIKSVVLKNGKEIFAKKFILATGGTSRPETGSTGDGFPWLKKLGHTLIESESALVPLRIKESWVKKLQGITLTNIKISTFQNNVKQDVSKGKILFTHFGVTGPTVLNMSKDIGELLKYGEVKIKIDLLPSDDHAVLNKKLQDLFTEDANKKIKNSLGSLVPSAIVEPILTLSDISGEIKNNSISKEARMKLIEVIKGLEMEVVGLLGNDKAVVSSGGVSLEEIDFKTMRSKIVENLYLVGDVLNIDRPSGGYSLQLCWTTGFVAGNDAGKREPRG